MPADDRIELELALRNAVSSTLQSITSDIQKTLKEFSNIGAEASSTGASGVAQSIRGISQLTEKTKDATKVFSSFLNVLAPMAGPAGVVTAIGVGLAGAVQQLNNFAGSQIKFKLLSEDIGFTTEQMSVMIRTFQRIGISAEASQQAVVQIGQTLKNLQTYAEGSELFRSLSFMGEGKFAKALLDAVKGGDFAKAFNMINEEYNRLHSVEGPAAAANFLATMHGVTESVAKNYDERSKRVKPAYEVNINNMKEFRNRIDNYKTLISNEWEKWKEYTLIKMNELFNVENIPKDLGPASPLVYGSGGVGKYTMEALARMGVWYAQPSEWWQQYGPRAVPGGPPDLSRRRRFGLGVRQHEITPEKKEEKQLDKDSVGTLGKIRDSIKNLFGTKPPEQRQFGGPVSAGRDYLVGERGPEIYSGGGRTEMVGLHGPQIMRPNAAGEILTNKEWKDRIKDAIQSGPLSDTTRQEIQKWLDTPKSERGRPPEIRYGFSEFESVPGRSQYEGGMLPEPGLLMEETERHGLALREGSPFKSMEEAEEWSMSDRWKRRDTPINQRTQIDNALRNEDAAGPPVLGAEINFRNIPPDVITNADGDGFDNFKVSKSKAMNI